MSPLKASILLLTALSLAASLLEQKALAAGGMVLALLAAAWYLHRHMAALSGLPEDHPKTGTLRRVTVFNACLLLFFGGLAVLLGGGWLTLGEDSERFLAASLVVLVLLVLGNAAPKLPFTRHTGLRLPWTVLDEETWRVAHRLLGHCAFPLAFLYIAAIPLVPSFEGLTLAVLLLWIAIPGGGSYLYFRKKFQG